MKIFANKEIKKLFLAVSVIWVVSLLLTQGFLWLFYQQFSLFLLLVSLLAGTSMLAVCCSYFRKQNKIMEQAVSQINAYLDGNLDARIECDYEGELYRLFHAVNSLAAVLNAHADNELREKEFLKNTISDISHQLKTPLAALHIYNGLLQDEDIEVSSVKEFAGLSEQELDRIETLVQSLLKLTRLDAGTVQLEKTEQDLQGLLEQTARPFACRARQEQKQLAVAAEQGVCLCCDRVWMREAVGNLIKNALDHTRAGDTVTVEGSRFADFVRIRVVDTGTGIHPEDLPHLFKRFYRSRFAQDTPGIGLGLPLAKSIVEVHGGTLEVESELGRGTAFTILLRNRPAPAIPTKL